MTVVTRSLSLNVIPDGRIERLELIASLYERGWNSIEIANHLNEQGMLTPSGMAYYPKLVWVTHNKFKRRSERRLARGLEISGMGFGLLT